MDELALIRQEQKRKYELTKKLNGGVAIPPSTAKPQGKVLCGKFFLDPPKQLTMHTMEQLLNTYVRVTPQKEPTISQLKMDVDSASFFQGFFQRSNFQIQRMGVMFGTFDEPSRTVSVDCIYEPKQASDANGFAELEDQLLDAAIVLAKGFHLRVVGWIFTHAPRAYFLSAAEVLKTAHLMAKYGEHCVVVSVHPSDDSGNTSFDAFQLSQQLSAIYKEGTLSVHPTVPDLVCSSRELEAVNEKKSDATHVLRQPCREVDVALFILPIPIVKYDSTIVRNKFSRINRPDHVPVLKEDVRNVLLSRDKEPFYQVLSDFHLLILLLQCGVISLDQDVPIICEAIRQKKVEPINKLRTRIQIAAGVNSSSAPKPKPVTTQPQQPSRPKAQASSSSSPQILEKDVREVSEVCGCTLEEARGALSAVEGNAQAAINLLLG